MDDEKPDTTLIKLASGIVESYVSNNQMQPDQVPELLESLHSRLAKLQSGSMPSDTVKSTGDELPSPPVKPNNSVRKNDVICLQCGKSYKTLKRHLRTEHGMEEQDYKKRWGLPATMKLVAKDYSARRSQMATQIGLGNKRSK